MAAPFWSSTLAPSENSPTEIRKGLFDLLKKLQEVSQYLDGFYQDGVLSVEEVDTQILRAVQIFLNGQDLSEWLNQDVRTTASPTFARVITPRVDNAGGALQLNPAGGNVLVGTTEGDTAGQKALFADANQFTRIGVENLLTTSVTKYSYYSALARSTAGTRKEAGTIYWESDSDVNNAGAGITTRSGNAAVTGFFITPAGYTKIGADAGAPGIKTKELTGTTSGSQGGAVSVAHGLTASKIFDIALSVDYSGAGTGFVPSNHSFSAGFNVDLAWGTTNIDVLNVSGNSASVLSKAFKLFITYKE